MEKSYFGARLLIVAAEMGTYRALGGAVGKASLLQPVPQVIGGQSSALSVASAARVHSSESAATSEPFLGKGRRAVSAAAGREAWRGPRHPGATWLQLGTSEHRRLSTDTASAEILLWFLSCSLGTMVVGTGLFAVQQLVTDTHKPELAPPYQESSAFDFDLGRPTWQRRTSQAPKEAPVTAPSTAKSRGYTRLFIEGPVKAGLLTPSSSPALANTPSPSAVSCEACGGTGHPPSVHSGASLARAGCDGAQQSQEQCAPCVNAERQPAL